MQPTALEALLQISHWNGIGRHDLALERARAALQQHSDDPGLLVEMGVALRGLGQIEDADGAARAALGVDPGNAGARVLLGELAQAAGRNREAEEHFLAALAEDPEDPGLLVAYAVLMHRTGHLEKAERLVRAALARDPEFAGAHSLLTLILAERERRAKEARAHGKHAVKLDPGSDLSHAALGYHEYATGRPFAARRHLREALRLDPSDVDVEEAYIAADRATRWLYLPMYYWTLLMQRVPGRQFAAWAALMAFLLFAPRIGLGAAREPVAVSYLAWVVYTWIATPLVKLWVLWRPAK